MDIMFMRDNEVISKVYPTSNGTESPGYPLGSSEDPRIGPNYIQKHPSIAIPYMVLICLATLTGTLGNILVICAIYAEKELRTVGNMFIVNLALADLCVTAFVNPFSIIGIIYGEIWFEDKPALCELIACLCLTACFCSLFSIGAISLNRYIHICKHKYYNRLYTIRNTLLMCLVLWTLSYLATVLNYLGWGDHGFDGKTLSCVWDRTASLSYTVTIMVVGVAFPVFLISMCYVMIYKHVLDSKRKVSQMNAAGKTGTEKGNDSQKQSKQLATTLFIIFIVFSVCWTPYAISVSFDYKDTWPQELHIFAVLLAHINSSLNSVLYGISNKNFRHAYLRLLGLRKCIPNAAGKTSQNGESKATTAVTTVTDA